MKATFTAEGRKKNCIIKLEEIEKISSVHREKNEDNANFIKNPHIFTYLHRLQSRKLRSNSDFSLNKFHPVSFDTVCFVFFVGERFVHCNAFMQKSRLAFARRLLLILSTN